LKGACHYKKAITNVLRRFPPKIGESVHAVTDTFLWKVIALRISAVITYM